MWYAQGFSLVKAEFHIKWTITVISGNNPINCKDFLVHFQCHTEKRVGVNM